MISFKQEFFAGRLHMSWRRRSNSASSLSKREDGATETDSWDDDGFIFYVYQIINGDHYYSVSKEEYVDFIKLNKRADSYPNKDII